LKNLKIFINEKYSNIITFIFLYFLIGTAYYYIYTPPHNIIFYDIDSRLNIDEVIQMYKATNVYDFIFDTFFGNFIQYGRITYILLFTFSIPFKVIFNFDYHYIVLLSHFSIMYISCLVIVKSLFKEKIIQILSIVSLMFLDFTSNFMIKTTSVELFMIALAIYFIKNSSIKNEYLIYVTLGVLLSIRFTNIVYLGTFFLLKVSNYKLDNFPKIFASFLFGFFIGQPINFTRYGFNWYKNWILDTINYDEGYSVTYLDWIEIIFEVFSGKIVLVIIFINFLTIFYFKTKLTLLEKFLTFSSLLHIFGFTFSDTLIRSHYLKIPMMLLFVSSILLIKHIPYLKHVYLLVFLLFNLNYFYMQSSKYENLLKHGDYTSYTTELETNEYFIASEYILKKILENPNIKKNQLIWWSPKNIYPYSNFHWGSTESISNEKYFIREIWGPSYEFSISNCADYGGIAVMYIDEKEILEIDQNMIKKNFELEFIYPLNNSQNNFYIYRSLKNELPYSC
jgi:hypothetical protein